MWVLGWWQKMGDTGLDLFPEDTKVDARNFMLCLDRKWDSSRKYLKKADSWSFL